MAHKIIETRCHQCGRLHRLAISLLACGRLDRSASPSVDRCYECLLRGLAPEQAAPQLARWVSLWLAAGGSRADLPAALRSG